MSAVQDDPDRYKPILYLPGKSQEDFHRAFHSISRGGQRVPQQELNSAAHVTKCKENAIYDV
jgi:hypothetical protein